MTAHAGSRRRRSLLIVLWTVGLFWLGGLGLQAIGERYRVGFDDQADTSLPARVYIADHGTGTFHRRDYIAFRAKGLEPYFADGTLMGKQIRAVPGDRLRIGTDGVFVNGERVGALPLVGKLDRPAHAYYRNLTVPEGRFFVMGTDSDSYDSRYWGFLERERIVATIYPVL